MFCLDFEDQHIIVSICWLLSLWNSLSIGKNNNLLSWVDVLSFEKIRYEILSTIDKPVFNGTFNAWNLMIAIETRLSIDRTRGQC